MTSIVSSAFPAAALMPGGHRPASLTSSSRQRRHKTSCRGVIHGVHLYRRGGRPLFGGPHYGSPLAAALTFARPIRLLIITVTSWILFVHVIIAQPTTSILPPETGGVPLDGQAVRGRGGMGVIGRWVDEELGQAVMHNVSRTLEDLLDSYDNRLRPQFGGEPLDIEMEIALASFDSISEVMMGYTITIYMNQYWKDERLDFSSSFIAEDNMTLTGDFADKIWVPDTFFANDKHSFLHDVTERNKMIRIHRDGSIEYSMRFTTTLACMMDLHNYPLDVQNCSVEIESYGYPMQDIVMKWKGDSLTGSIHGVDNVEIPQFTIEDYRIGSTVETSAMATSSQQRQPQQQHTQSTMVHRKRVYSSVQTGSYQRLSLSFKLKRNFGYFIFQTYLPSILIVMLSWVSFWINHEATSARVALGITTVLTMTTISTGVRSSLPRISYIKAIDIYLVVCFVFVFAALLEYAAVNYRFWGARARRRSKYLKDLQKREHAHEESLQLEEEQWSPIMSLRNRHHNNGGQRSTLTTRLGEDYQDDIEDSVPGYLPFRMHAAVPHYPYHAHHHRAGCGGGGTALVRRLLNRRPRPVVGTFQKRKQILSSLKKKADRLTESLPTFTDVNRIDKGSRVAFPSLFLVFNIGYWCFYVFQ